MSLHNVAFNLQYFTRRGKCPPQAFPTSVQTNAPDFESFLIHLDSRYILLRQTMNNFWNQRIPKKRSKLAAKEQLAILLRSMHISQDPYFLEYVIEPDNTSNFKFLLSKWLGNTDYTTVDKIHRTFEREKHWKSFTKASKTYKNPSTQIWTKPSGIIAILLNKAVGSFYKFSDGSYLFPKDYTRKRSKNFFKRKHIPDGVILNPPYKTSTLNITVAFLLRAAREQRAVFVILVPYWPTAFWFKTLQLLNTPCLLLENNLYYKRGINETFSGKASFQSCLFLIGANTHIPIVNIRNDELGFPMSLDYIEAFNNFVFPQSLAAAHGNINFKNFAPRIHILLSFLEHAEQSTTSTIDADITAHFDLSNLQKYNYLLQKSYNSDIVPDSHQWNSSLNPWIKERVTWTPYKPATRVIYTFKTGMNFINSFTKPPKDKYKNTICKICKNTGHHYKFCFFKIPTTHQLGLAYIGDKILYNYICSLPEAEPSPAIDHFQSPNQFLIAAKHWLKLENQFWENWKVYALEANIHETDHIIYENEFAKGRQALGFNWANGATKRELLLDAFGARLDLEEAPPPCEFVASIEDNTPTYAKIPEILQTEDETEIKRRTQYVIPKNYIKYILPRFVVTNTDQTQRSINDCQLLGPFTPVFPFRLATPIALRNFGCDDIILSIDGKSAYKQRRLAWSARNKIGFRTVINGTTAYVAMATPPFGMHNAGYIYQKSLEAKLNRAAGQFLWIEYIDDVSIRIGAKNFPLSLSTWNASAFLWLLTKSGEILNNKFYIFKDIITMMGMHYSLSNDRFVPKINSFFKLALHITNMLKKPQISLKDLEILAGKINWLSHASSTSLLKPLYNFIGQTKSKHKPKTSNDHKKLQHLKIDWNRQLLQIIFTTLWDINKHYKQFNEINISHSNKIAYIVSDANPMVAGAYIAIGRKTLSFEKIKPIMEDTLELPALPKAFIQKHKLQSFFHSTRKECEGLSKYIRKHRNEIHKHIMRVDKIIVLGDNLALITNLQKKQAAHCDASFEYNRLFKLLKSFNKPYEFRWLRRSYKPIEIADALGRVPLFTIKQHVIQSAENFFECKIFIPHIFQDTRLIPFKLPYRVLLPILKSPKIPLIVFPPDTTKQTFALVMECLDAHNLRILIATPFFNRQLIRTHLDLDSFLTIKRITSQDFSGPNITLSPRRNLPFYIAFKKQHA